MRLPFILPDDDIAPPAGPMTGARPKSRVIEDVRQSLKVPKPRRESAFTPKAHRCVCGALACYGLTAPAVVVDQWFCRAHVPAGFLPSPAVAA